jgi:NAD(P)-dependent dehydrogenase (short-subunit alcohol dehydrogenase family)
MKAIDFVLTTHGRLDVAFNNAGVEIAGPLHEVTEEQYRRTFDINVWGVLNSMKHEVAAMLKTESGAIVNTSSLFGHIAFPQSSIYVGTKHAVEGLTKAVALEFAKQGIRVNSVAPGLIATDMIDRVAGKEGDRRNWLVSQHPVGRFGTSEDIAAAVLYLASDAAKFTTGTTLLVDGGVTAA